MKSLKHLVVLIAALFLTAGVIHGQKGSDPMKNDDVIQMVGAGLGDDAIVDLIQSSSSQFDVSNRALAALKKAKVSGKVIEAMRAAEAANKSTAKAAPAPVTSAMAVAQTAPKALTNDDVIAMFKGGLGESTIICAIQSQDTNFDISATGLLQLKKSGVSLKIMDAVMFSFVSNPLAASKQHWSVW